MKTTITTIQIRTDVKNELDKLKRSRESYEEVITALIKFVEKHRREQKELLVRGYKEMAKEGLLVHKEWSSIDKDWEYDD